MTEQTPNTLSQDDETGLTYTAYDITLLQRIAGNPTGLMVVYRRNLLDAISAGRLMTHGYVAGTPGNAVGAPSFIMVVTDAGRDLIRTLTAEAKKYSASWGPVDLAYHRETMDQALAEQCLREDAYNAGYTDGIAVVTLSNEEIDAINEAFSKIDAGPVALSAMKLFTELKRRAEEG